MRILCLDLSLKSTGYAIGPIPKVPPPLPLEGDPFRHIERSGSIGFKAPDRADGTSFAMLHDFILDVIVGERIGTVCIEEAFTGRNRASNASQFGCEAMAKAAAARAGKPVRSKGARELQKFAVGKSVKGSKQHMLDIVQRTRAHIETTDESDALWLAVFFQTKWAGKVG